MNYEESDDNDISYTDSENMDQDSNNIVENDHNIENMDQDILPPTDSNSLSTQSSNSVYSSQTKQTTFSNSSSTQATTQMSSVASMVSDTREKYPISTHRQESEWTVVKPSKNNNSTKIREAGLIRLVHTDQHKSSGSLKYNRFDLNSVKQQRVDTPKTNSPTSNKVRTESKDLCTSSPLQSSSNRECEDQVT